MPSICARVGALLVPGVAARCGLLASAALLIAATFVGGSARADDAGTFIVTLGRDTTSVEHYRRTPSRLDVQQIGRTPRVLERRFTYEFARDAIVRFAMVVTPVGSTTPTQTIEAQFGPDSVHVAVRSGDAPVQTSVVAIPLGTVVVTNSSPWVGYESQTMKLVQEKRDALQAPLWFVGAGSTNRLDVRRIGRDSLELVTDRGDVYRTRVDGAGRIVGLRPVTGPAQFAVERVAKLDLDAMGAAYAARERAGTGLGVLSPRDTVRAVAGGANLTVDYGRPAKRGRVVFGGVVPHGQIWRTGANAATQFRTDKGLDFHGTIVPAGFYTLWTVPNPNGWRLIVNSETGQWGTAHKPENDLHTIDMGVDRLPQVVERFTITVEPSPQGGVLHFDWDTTRASAAFRVQP